MANSNEEFSDVTMNHQNSIDGMSLGSSNGQSENGSGSSASVEIVIPSWRVLPVKASPSGDLTGCEVRRTSTLSIGGGGREREREMGREDSSLNCKPRNNPQSSLYKLVIGELLCYMFQCYSCGFLIGSD